MRPVVKVLVFSVVSACLRLTSVGLENPQGRKLRASFLVCPRKGWRKHTQNRSRASLAQGWPKWARKRQCVYMLGFPRLVFLCLVFRKPTTFLCLVFRVSSAQAPRKHLLHSKHESRQWPIKAPQMIATAILLQVILPSMFSIIGIWFAFILSSAYLLWFSCAQPRQRRIPIDDDKDNSNSNTNSTTTNNNNDNDDNNSNSNNSSNSNNNNAWSLGAGELQWEWGRASSAQGWPKWARKWIRKAFSCNNNIQQHSYIAIYKYALCMYGIRVIQEMFALIAGGGKIKC